MPKRRARPRLISRGGDPKSHDATLACYPDSQLSNRALHAARKVEGLPARTAAATCDFGGGAGGQGAPYRGRGCSRERCRRVGERSGGRRRDRRGSRDGRCGWCSLGPCLGACTGIRGIDRLGDACGGIDGCGGRVRSQGTGRPTARAEESHQHPAYWPDPHGQHDRAAPDPPRRPFEGHRGKRGRSGSDSAGYRFSRLRSGAIRKDRLHDPRKPRHRATSACCP
jgi:hypothetical protein